MRHALLADTGPLYAAFDPRDGNHARALEDQRRLRSEGRPVVVPYPVLLEGHNLAQRKLGHRKAREFARQVEKVAVLEAATAEDHAKAHDALDRYPDQEISLTDAVVARMSTRLGLPIWTHDHHFDAMGANVWR